MADNKYLLDMECNSCGASVSLDVDNLIAFCPYCGNKLMVDPIAFRDLLVEREKTKRIAMQHGYDAELRAEQKALKQKRIKMFVISVVLSVSAFLVAVECASFLGNTIGPILGLAGLAGIPVSMFLCANMLGAFDKNKNSD